ncbi:choice-of-anchor Q domain-containing protein [Parabacteroides sp. PF5-6]|uniref:choice-of-anchor Q domain-containing protein n=1 Tax=Parabacteroides sp. PF5-6 TaxID=1742403 RepID=UPI002407548B|nr:choice-of-anchor Q domain-containing protein [Parabacteroides sp. PF5-6]MDF9830835.1 hypothetical protein [Parabacteroides sp. PF5-6]
MTQKLHLILTLCLLGLTLSLPAFAAPAADVIYVKHNATGTPQNGKTWETAYTDLAEVLNNLAADAAPVEIWVATGTYKPTDGTDRYATFTIPTGITVYGGFAGTETSLDARDWTTNPTTLSGDINPTTDDDCYHVVHLTGGTLDGFYITGANAGRSSTQGAGVWAEGGTLRNNTIYGNSAGGGSGGGVYAGGGTILTGNTIYDNEAAQGGGVYALGGATLTGNTIYGNEAALGGGVYALGGATLTGNTIYANTASYGGGVFIYNGTPTLTHNILWANTAEYEGANLSINNGTTPAITYNLIGDDEDKLSTYKTNGNLIGTTKAINPRFVKIDTQSDPKVYDFRLTPYSPCIGTGRPLDDGTPTDMGAYPYQAKADENGIVYVISADAVDTDTEDYAGDGSSWANGTNLSEALRYAADPDNEVSQIWVAKGSYIPKYKLDNGQPLSERDRTFVIPPGVKVYGGFAGTGTSLNARDWVTNVTILSGEIGDPDDNTDNCYHVVVMALQLADVDVKADVEAETATLDGFSVTGGMADANNSILVNGTAISRNIGGGVLAYTAILTNNTISGNTAGYGAGVFASGTTLSNNTIYDNTATTNGGGVYANSAILTNNTIYGNTADEANGGGVYSIDGATLNNNILWGNEVGNAEGAKDLYVKSYSTASGSHNLIGFLPERGGKYTGTDDLIGEDIDPLFVDATNGDFRLQEGSPLVDAGDNAAYGSTYPTTDAAGNPRFKGARIDIGAYEYQSADDLTYHPLTLEVAPGILLYGISAGEHLVSDHLFLQFLPEDPALGPEDLMLVIDGVDTPFTVPAGGAYYGYILPITAEHTILIAQRRYNVILTPTEGVTYTPAAGTHSVPYGEAFSFALTGDFDPALIQVYANDQEISPNNSPQSPTNLPQGEALRSEALRVGASLSYTIDRVTGPVTVTLEGYTTSNASLTHGIRLAIDNGQLTIDNEMANAVDVAVYSVTGQNVAQLRGLRGSKTVALAAGVYFVRAGSQTWKVVVN